MTIYYRDDAVTVSSTAIEVDDRRYPLERLSYVWHRTRRSARVGGARLLRTKLLFGTVVGVAAVIAAVVVLLSLDFGRYTWYVLTGAALVAIVLAAVAGFEVDPVLDLLDRGHEHGRGVHEVWARIDGREILLFRTRDELRFGKVYRALQRAIERTSGGDATRRTR